MSIAVPPERQIDVRASVRTAYTIVMDNVLLAVALALVPFAVLLSAEFIVWLVSGSRLGQIVGPLISSVAFVLFDSVFVVRWHRFVLLGEATTDQLFPMGWGAFVLTAVKVGLLVFLGCVVLVVLVALTSGFLRVVIVIIGASSLVLASTRILLAFPAAAIGRPISLVGDAWDLATGNFWRLLACLICCCAPFGIVHYLVDEIVNSLPSIPSAAFRIIALAVTFAGEAVAASLLSEVYRRLSSNARAAERPAS